MPRAMRKIRLARLFRDSGRAVHFSCIAHPIVTSSRSEPAFLSRADQPNWEDNTMLKNLRRTVHYFAIGLQTLAVGCGTAPADDTSLGQLQSEIRNGTIVSPWSSGAPDESRSIVWLGNCTATVIDPEWVLSAAHCALSTGQTVASFRPSGNQYRTIDRVVAHPTTDAVLAHLSRPFKDTPRVHLHPGATSDITGSSVTCYGYGAKAVGATCSLDTDCNTGEWCQGGWCLKGSAELRSGVLPTRANSDPFLFDTQRNALDQMTLPGDSGGPCFRGATLAGVNSAWYLDLSGGIHVSVPSIRDWAHLVMQRQSYLADASFSDANGWNAHEHYYGTIGYPDLNGDGRADICGRGGYGINCGLSTGSGFSATRLWHSEFSDANGWNVGPQYYGTIAYPDVNGDGKADVCGRASSGIVCALSNGTSFGPHSVWSPDFKDLNGWNYGPQYYGTITFPDINGDGRADVCGRGSAGVECALSTGTTFGRLSIWEGSFSDANGWNNGPEYYSTIRFIDINADGRADICGRGSAGLLCATSDGSRFASLALWDASFSDANGWNNGPEYYGTLAYADLDADGRADVCGRGASGMICSRSSGLSFTGARLWTGAFDDASSGNRPEYYRTITLTDLDYDGKADFCGRGTFGVYCEFSTGSRFTGARYLNTEFSDRNGWAGAPYYRTLRFLDPDGGGRKLMCARGSGGIICLR